MLLWSVSLKLKIRNDLLDTSDGGWAAWNVLALLVDAILADSRSTACWALYLNDSLGWDAFNFFFNIPLWARVGVFDFVCWRVWLRVANFPIFPSSILFWFSLLVLQGIFGVARLSDSFVVPFAGNFLGWMIVPSWLLLLLLNRTYVFSLGYVYTLLRFCIRPCELDVASFPGVGVLDIGIDSVAIAMSFFLMTVCFRLGVSLVTAWGEYPVIVPSGIIFHWDASARVSVP